MGITVYGPVEESSGLVKERQVVDLGRLMPCGRVQRIWEREAGSGPEMAIALWKSPVDLGERSR
jgi:hypothetical protein